MHLEPDPLRRDPADELRAHTGRHQGVPASDGERLVLVQPRQASSMLLDMKPLVGLATSASALSLLAGGVAWGEETKPLKAVITDSSGDVEGDGDQDTKDATDVSEVRYAAVRDDRLDKSAYSVRFSVFHARSLADGEHRAVSQFI